MSRDIDTIVERMREIEPTINVEQLKVKFAADDDGIWFFNHPDSQFEVQLESPYGRCPFLIETCEHDERIYAQTVDEAIEVLKSWLHLKSK